MGVSLLQTVAALVSTCTRRLRRAARRIGGAGAGGVGGVKVPPSPSRAVVPWRKAFSLPLAKGKGRGEEEGVAAGGGVWRKEILMGERCQPLDFSGVIYYDADGRRLAQPPPPRSPMRSPLPASPRLSAAHAHAY